MKRDASCGENLISHVNGKIDFFYVFSLKSIEVRLLHLLLNVVDHFAVDIFGDWENCFDLWARLLV